MKTVFACLFLLLFTSPVSAATGLPIPRFVSLRVDTANMRTGPGMRYPIEWVYQTKGQPFVVVAEFDIWRKVRDWEGGEGWIHQGMLSGKRMVRVIGTGLQPLLTDSDGRVKGYAEPGVLAVLKKCPSKKSVCLIDVNGEQGWISRTVIFGIFQDEHVE